MSITKQLDGKILVRNDTKRAEHDAKLAITIKLKGKSVKSLSSAEQSDLLLMILQHLGLADLDGKVKG